MPTAPFNTAPVLDSTAQAAPLQLSAALTITAQVSTAQAEQVLLEQYS